MSLKVFLTRLIWLCVSPLMVLAIYLAGDHVYRMQYQRNLQAIDQLQNIGAAFERNLETRIAALQMLAASPLADDPARLDEFFMEAQNYRESFSGHVVFSDLAMRMVFSTRVELGTSLPKLPRPKGHAAAPTALATGGPAVGDMFFGPIAGEPLVAVVVPVVRNDQPRSLLLSIMETAQFQQHFDEMALPAGWRLTLLDGKDEVMASSASSNGEKNQPGKGAAARKYAVKLKGAPWSLVLEIPHKIYYAPLISSTAALLIAIVIVTFIGIQGGRLTGRRLARAVATLSSPSMPGDSPFNITEIEIVRHRLDDEAAVRFKAEEYLRQNERVLRLFVEHSPASIAMFDREMRYVVASRRFRIDYDLGEQDVTGRSHYEVFPEIPERWKEIHRRCLAGATEKADNDPFPRRDGSMDYVRWEIRPWYEEKDVIGGIILFSEVMTEQVRILKELRVANEELQTVNRIIATTTTTTTEVQDILENVLDHALAVTGLEGGTICMVTEDDTLHLAAHRATSATTIKDLSTNAVRVGECLCGECARDHRPLVLHDREEVHAFATREAIRGEDIRFHAAFPLVAAEECLGVLCVFTRTDAKPSERSLKLLESVSAQIAMAVRNAQLHEEMVQLAKTLEDKVRARTRDLEEARAALISNLEDMKGKSEALAEANDKLQGLDRLKSLFIASMSHELRTPLNSVIGFSSILKEEWLGPVNDEQKKNLGYILDSGKHLLALINDVIDLSKVEAGRLEITPTRFSLPDLVAEAVNAIQQSAADKGLEINTRIEPCALFADRRRLLQCLLNLLSNAVKFTAKGSIAVTAETGAGKDENAVVKIIVKDTGIGIPPEDQGKLFKPFVRLHSPGSSEYPGTGLGLYLTGKLVNEVLRGEIHVASTHDAGSRFTIEMPVMASRDRNAGMAEQPEKT